MPAWAARWRPPPRPETASGDFLARPRLTAGVTVHPPVEDGAPWLIQRGEHRYFRIGADLAALSAQLDGRRDSGDLAAVLGQPWDAEAVGRALTVLDGARLIARDDKPTAPVRRVRYVPPLTLQIAVLRSATGVAAALNNVLAPALRAVTVAMLLAGVLGVISLVARWDTVLDLLSRPISFTAVLAVLGAVALTTAVHELGHACVLQRYGGRPGRLGLMLFYLSPAFFCDVSDAWRLPRNVQRVRVALAGVVVQVGISGLAALAALVAPAGTAVETLILFAVVSLAAAALNLVPFVKLDGYIALMSHLDRPNLRAHSMRRLRDELVALVTGARVTRRATDPRWLPWFGAACVATPVVLVLRVLGRWIDAFLSLGYFGVALSVALAGFLLTLVGKAAVGLGRDLHRSGLRPVRTAVAAVVAAVAVVALGNVGISTSETAGYRTGASGQIELVVPAGQHEVVLQPGDRVELRRAGMVLSEPVGTGTVAQGTPSTSLVPLGAFLPVRLDGLDVPGHAYPMTVDAVPDDEQGMARINRRTVPLYEWAYARFVAPALALF